MRTVELLGQIVEERDSSSVMTVEILRSPIGFALHSVCLLY